MEIFWSFIWKLQFPYEIVSHFHANLYFLPFTSRLFFVYHRPINKIETRNWIKYYISERTGDVLNNTYVFGSIIRWHASHKTENKNSQKESIYYSSQTFLCHWPRRLKSPYMLVQISIVVTYYIEIVVCKRLIAKGSASIQKLPFSSKD